MARPDYLICLECESEVADFTWRDGEVRRVTCDVCGNTDSDAFSLPEDYDQGVTDGDPEEEELEDEEEEDEYLDDYDNEQEEEEEE